MALSIKDCDIDPAQPTKAIGAESTKVRFNDSKFSLKAPLTSFYNAGHEVDTPQIDGGRQAL